MKKYIISPFIVIIVEMSISNVILMVLELLSQSFQIF